MALRAELPRAYFLDSTGRRVMAKSKPAGMDAHTAPANKRLDRERLELTDRLDNWLEIPMLVLSLVWLGLLVAELTLGERPWVMRAATAIWIVLIVDFAIKISLAPRKLAYLRKNWLTVIALLIPALRVFRVLRFVQALRYARAARGIRLFRVIATLNRGTRALGATFARHGFGYVVIMTLVVTFGGAAGMYAFEGGTATGITDYGSALWWTAMIMTTLGSELASHLRRAPALRIACALRFCGIRLCNGDHSLISRGARFEQAS